MIASTITFVVSGQDQDAVSRDGVGASAPSQGAATLGLRGRVKHSVRVGARRGAGAQHRIDAVPGADIVVLHLDGGPALVLHPETARDLMLAQSERAHAAARGAGGAGRPEAPPIVVDVPDRLAWLGAEPDAAARGATRGALGGVLLSAVEVITGHIGEDLKAQAQITAAKAVAKRIDAKVGNAVYALQPDALTPLIDAPKLKQIAGAAEGEPSLVLVHGTFSDSPGTFAKLWTQHPQRVRVLFDRYRSRVYTLDHPTLGQSPIENALTLARACPKGTRLHLLTHSRGGLVAESLARVCANPVLSAEDRQFFAAPALANQLKALEELVSEVKSRGITVDRIVRVACPARGTLLASKRFDAYLSVLKWTLELAGIPVAPELVDFVGGVAQCRLDPMVLPGVAEMVPDSATIQWLHAVDEPLPGDLRVVAGDIQGDSVMSWLKTLLADSFYWADNDLVVQTRSMYGGAPRRASAGFVLDSGGKTSHFNYFFNELTAEAVVNGLTQDAPSGHRSIGPLSWAGESAAGLRGAARAARAAADAKPANVKPCVFVLPGILGSHIKVDGERIWLGWRLINGLKKLEYPDAAGRQVEPDGPIGTIYEDLMDFLAQSHEVIEFSFDWRKPIEDEAQRLGQAVETALTARAQSAQPVRIVAHSMGGLVARTMQLQCPKTWDRMMAHPGARLLMLGTPNGGSWAPMQVLSGDDTFGNTLVSFGAPFQDHSARALMAQFPGFIQLQAELLDDSKGLARSQTWQKLADDDLAQVRSWNWWHADERQLNTYRWGVPTQGVIDRAVALRKRLDSQRAEVLQNYSNKIALVVGRADFTPDGYELGNEGLVYLNAAQAGDGRVTLASALLPGVPTWWLDCEHGKLPDYKGAFDAFLQLLTDGNTTKLPVQPEFAAARGAAAGPSAAVVHVRGRPSRARSAARLPEDVSALNRLPEATLVQAAREAPAAALRVTVQNGDLTFVRQPLMLGHYQSLALTGTERVVNRLIGASMEQSLAMGQYPDEPGTHQIFANNGVNRQNPLQMPRPESVIVVGLGPEGKLRPGELVKTVRLATIAWAQRMLESPFGTPAQFELAATLIGSGGTGVSAGQSAQLIAQGVHSANQALTRLQWPRVSRLTLIELYLDRATDAWRTLQMQADAAPASYRVDEAVVAGLGALRCPADANYRGTAHDLISAITEPGAYAEATIAYVVDSKRARSELRTQRTQGPLLRELIRTGSNTASRDKQIGRTLFQLLVPEELEPFMGGTTEMVLELDAGTAGIPWEILDTESGAPVDGERRPWAIRSKLLRKLRTETFRSRVIDANSEAHVLVIGDPVIGDPRYPRLAGARAEARAVADRLGATNALGPTRVRTLISSDDTQATGPDAHEVINALMARDWRIVHIAGHGEPPEMSAAPPIKDSDPQPKLINPRGVVLSNDTFLGPREIHNMRVVPELVFVNCCHLAARDPANLLHSENKDQPDRAQFAAGVADELIKIGVRCVVAAGWAVDDFSASVFAVTFYTALLAGQRFSEAVSQARVAAWDGGNSGNNTWAAYQCYGDPDWTFRPGGADAQRPPTPLADQFAGVASPMDLALALETLAVQSRFQGYRVEEQRARIRYLQAHFEPLWGGIGAVAEAFALAWDATGDRVTAAHWYQRALDANDGSASLKASEQLGNLRARLAWDKSTTAPKQAAQEIGLAIELLEKVVAMQATMERESLCASAHKRKAMISAAANDAATQAQALAAMTEHYRRAEAIGRATGAPEVFYPALNLIAGQLVCEFSRPGWKGLDPDITRSARQSLVTKTRDDPDFWSVAGLTELRVYEALAQAQLLAEWQAIETEYDDLHARVAAPDYWSSVLDQMNFVLPKVMVRAGAGEKKAADALLKKLRAYAGQ